MRARLRWLITPIGLVAACSVVVIAASTVQLAAGSGAVGVSPDEINKATSLRTWFDTGWYVLPRTLDADGEPRTGAVSPYVYGAAYSITGHALNVIAGNEDVSSVSFAPPAFRVRHVVTALLGLVTALAVGLATWCLTRAWTAGLVSSAALLAIPAWTGLSFFHSKDVTVAAGYSLVTAGLLLALSRTDGRRQLPGARWVAGILVAAGVFYGVGTRFAIWLPVAIAGAMFVVLVLLRRRSGEQAATARPVLNVAVGAGVGVGAIAALHPNLFADPVTLLTRSVSASSDFPWEGFTLTAGELLPAQPPWWYVPAWVGASLPIIIGCLAVAGFAAVVRLVVVSVKRPEMRRTVWQRQDVGVALVITQAMLLPLGIMILGSTMYAGIAKLLFTLPALAILAGFGFSALWRWGAASRWSARALWLISGAVVVGLVVPSVEQIRLFPYNSAYKNPVAGIAGVNGVWEMSPVGVAGREAIRRVPSPELRWDSKSWSASLHKEERGLDAKPGTLREGEYWFIAKNQSDFELPASCEPFDNVTRPLRGEDLLLYYVARCSDPGNASEN